MQAAKLGANPYHDLLANGGTFKAYVLEPETRETFLTDVTWNVGNYDGMVLRIGKEGDSSISNAEMSD